MNLLITCAGRRNYLIDYFKEALLPVGGKVHVFNTNSDSAAYWQADVPVISPFANAIPTKAETKLFVTD